MTLVTSRYGQYQLNRPLRESILKAFSADVNVRIYPQVPLGIPQCGIRTLLGGGIICHVSWFGRFGLRLCSEWPSSPLLQVDWSLELLEARAGKQECSVITLAASVAPKPASLREPRLAQAPLRTKTGAEGPLQPLMTVLATEALHLCVSWP